MEGNEWVIEYHKKLGKALSEYAVEKLGRPTLLVYGYALMGKAMKSYPIMWEHGGLGPAGELFNGGYGGRGEVDLEEAANWHHEHGCFLSYSIEDHPMEFGPISEIEEQMKAHVLKHKHMPRFVPAAKATYWAPMEHIDAAFAAVKKYGRYE
ncbi:hypothetical protein ACFLW2_03110 [Chloroflexota bacterium]